MNRMMAPKKIMGRKLMNRPKRLPSPPEPFTLISRVVTSTPASVSTSTMLALLSLRDLNVSPPLSMTLRESSLTSMVRT